MFGCSLRPESLGEANASDGGDGAGKERGGEAEGEAGSIVKAGEGDRDAGSGGGGEGEWQGGKRAAPVGDDGGHSPRDETEEGPDGEEEEDEGEAGLGGHG